MNSYFKAIIRNFNYLNVISYLLIQIVRFYIADAGLHEQLLNILKINSELLGPINMFSGPWSICNILLNYLIKTFFM